MAQDSITVDNGSWSVEYIKSFSSVTEFVAAHATQDWFPEGYFEKLYNIVNTEQPKEKKGSSK